jgi:8-oxo-dGTP pyrophosphatase MutT (NUDIX family)
MYEIYINGRPLCFSAIPENGFQPSSDPSNLTTIYTGSPKSLLGYMDMMEKNKEFMKVTLYSPDVEKLFLDFKSQFTVLEAAGGLVFNPTGKALMIYRLEHWDLPKGKIDPGETPEQAAVREVQEETGLKEVKIERPMQTTYHTYRHAKKGRIFKPTYWYRMTTAETALIPQAEEQIERAEWRDIQAFLEEEHTVYPNIVRLLKEALGTAQEKP